MYMYMYLPGSSCQLVLWPCTWQIVHHADTQHSLPPKPGFLIKQKSVFLGLKICYRPTNIVYLENDILYESYNSRQQY